ncbi:hypothetical protein [Brevibacillus sp. VP]|uniref:hypothetical protein n=1 Tax=unclassified Brevibacillus TaxID=2684853 RepID=UPI000E2F6B71|nr:hypothetical protein [Brevibacillus sp. VP]RFB28224.1 hypothetical protein DZB91_24375 [Brevibacillus sp. VP]
MQSVLISGYTNTFKLLALLKVNVAIRLLLTQSTPFCTVLGKVTNGLPLLNGSSSIALYQIMDYDICDLCNSLKNGYSIDELEIIRSVDESIFIGILISKGTRKNTKQF